MSKIVGNVLCASNMATDIRVLWPGGKTQVYKKKIKYKTIRIIHRNKNGLKIYLIMWESFFGIKICLPAKSLILHISEFIISVLFCIKIIESGSDKEQIVSENLTVKIRFSTAHFYYKHLQIFECTKAQLKFALFAMRSAYKNDFLKNSHSFKGVHKYRHICSNIVNNLSQMHTDIDDAIAVFKIWKNICENRCYFVSYNTDCVAENNLYKYCNEACTSIEVPCMIALYNLSLIQHLQNKRM